MTLDEIKRAVDTGRPVRWASDIYHVIKGSPGQYLIVCQANGSTIGLHGREGTPYANQLNGSPDDFYIYKGDSLCH